MVIVYGLTLPQDQFGDTFNQNLLYSALIVGASAYVSPFFFVLMRSIFCCCCETDNDNALRFRSPRLIGGSRFDWGWYIRFLGGAITAANLGFVEASYLSAHA